MTPCPSTDQLQQTRLARALTLLALALAPAACEEPVLTPRFIPGPTADQSQGSATERDALVAFYTATDGPNWTRSDNWLSDAPLEDWYGIVTNDEGQVRWLTLWDNGLKGPIVPDLGDLAALELLGLGDNQLTGELPAELASAAALTGLWIDDNLLTGVIPSSFLELSDLRVFDFGGNQELCIPGTARFREWTDSVSVVVGPDCSEADTEILRVLHERTGGGFWTNSDGWLSEAALSDWHGVETDTIGRVTGLDMSQNGLSGELPDSLSELSALVKLDVSGNILAGALPVALTALSLKELRYSDTQLCVPQEEDFLEWLAAIEQHEGSGRECPPTSHYDILKAIYEATNGPKWLNNDNWLTDAPLGEWYGVGTDSNDQVVSLSLSYNFLQGQIPPEIGGLSSLEYLGLGGSYALTGPLPDELFDLPNLRTLNLRRFNMGGAVPTELTRLTQLEWLSLAVAGLGGPLPAEIAQLTNLNYLDLSYNDLVGSTPPELGSMAGLRTLDLSYNEFTGGIPPQLGDLTNLRRLELDNNRLNGSIPRELGKLVNLHTLALHKNDLDGAVPVELGTMTGLVSLWLALNPGLSGPLPDALTALDGLSNFRAGSTGLCAPEDEDFLAWLDGIEFHRVARCEPAATAYLTQPIQSLQFPVPLVAGRPALLRIFVFSPQATGERMPEVRATFYHDGAEVHNVEIEGGSAAMPTELDESSLTYSANADIPGDVVQPGLEMVIDVDPDGTLGPALGIAKRMPATGRLPVDVREMPDFQLTLVPFLYEADPDSSILEITAGMASDPEKHPMFRDTRALLPIGEFDVALHDPVATSTTNGFQLMRDTEAIRAHGRPARGTGWPCCPLRRARDCSGSPTASARGRAIRSRLSRTIAHEFGHNMNLWHAPCGGAGGP